MDIIRDSFVGQALRYATNNRILLYPEEKPGFTWAPLTELLEQERIGADVNSEDVEKKTEPLDDIPESGSDSGDPDLEKEEHVRHFAPIHAVPTARDHDISRLSTNRSSASIAMSRTSTRPYTRERFDVEQALEAEKTKSIAMAPTKTADGTILVDWYSNDDKENPQNWSKARKWVVVILIALYSMAVYGSSSMYAPAQEGVMHEFHVGHAPAALGLAIFVIGYGLGPLLWAPLSEIPIIGRNLVYAPTYMLFVILSIPTAVVDNYAGLLVLRFLTGFFGSPCLSNGGASLGDIFGLLELPIYLASWTVACFWGPAIGPVIAGFAVQHKGWRWGLWEIVWLNAPIVVAFLLFCPETSADYILRARAARLRKLTGNPNIKSQSEINQAQMEAREVAYEALIKPVEIMIKDPAIAFTNLYTALIYGIYYASFEVFPLIYPPIYHFNLGETGLTFLTIGVGCIFGVTSFLAYQIWYLIPDIKKNGLRAPEHRLIPALIGVLFSPAGYFMFGWTARHAVHWIASLIGTTIFVMANFWIFQSIFIYLPLSYPRYAASLFAANDVCRSMFAAGCVLFARPMFVNLGIGGGVSLLAGLACLGVGGMFYLWKYGAWLRSKSTFAQS